MISLRDYIENAGAGNTVYLLQLLDLESGRHRDILRWCQQQDLELELLEWPHGQLYSVKFSAVDDPRIQQWTAAWENEDGSSRDHESYRMIQVNVT